MRKIPYKLSIATAAVVVGLSGATVITMSATASAHGADEATTGAKLTADNLKSCQKRELAINNIMKRLVERASKQEKVLDTIHDRTEEFYNKKGHKAPTFEEVMMTVDSPQTKAEADLAAMKEARLDCGGDNPKDTIADFKVSLKAWKTDFKAYKTGLVNLIQTTADAQSAKPAASNSPSASTKGGMK